LSKKGRIERNCMEENSVGMRMSGREKGGGRIHGCGEIQK
jgi:hypothetical protein